MAEVRERELVCSVCLGDFRDPKVLPCCHSYCCECLEGVLQRSMKTAAITCPQCRTEHKVGLVRVRVEGGCV